MSRPIKLTQQQAEVISAEIIAKIMGTNMADGKISFERVFKWDNEQKARLGFSLTAFSKMMMLVQNFDSEVAWHGTVSRNETDDSSFLIEDILVYPQEVTGATVNTDQIKYQTWLMELDDATFNKLRMQGHSHVNMATSPSNVDLTHQGKILEQLEDDMFYIFMIWNKKFEFNIKIYDLKNNTLYETRDIELYVQGININLQEFVKQAGTMVAKKTYSYPGYNSYNKTDKSPSTTNPATTTPAVTTSPTHTDKPKNRTDVGKDWNQLHISNT